MLVGRDAEQRALGELLRLARDGPSAALVLRGEPGVGNAELVDPVVLSNHALRQLSRLHDEHERSSRSTTASRRRPSLPSAPACRAQELRIARLVASGASNRDAATQLFRPSSTSRRRASTNACWTPSKPRSSRRC